MGSGLWGVGLEGSGFRVQGGATHLTFLVCVSQVEECVPATARESDCACAWCAWIRLHRKVDVRLPGKGNSDSHGAGPAHLIITMVKWIRTSRLSIKNSLSGEGVRARDRKGEQLRVRVVRLEERRQRTPPLRFDQFLWPVAREHPCLR